MSEPLLAVDGLTKRFGGLTATDHLSLDVRDGELHALIGPNGAGKTTFIAQLMGEIRPDAGAIRFGRRGHRAPADRQPRAARPRAHVPDHPAAAG